MKLSAWQIVFALLFWTQLGGFLGLLLAIPLTAFVKASWDEWRDSTERFVHMPEETTEVVKKDKAHVS
jgi:predicted PurR-regulated permease PerM